MKIYFIWISPLLSLHRNNKNLLSFLCYVHYAVVKTKKTLFFVNNNNNFTTMFTTPKSWKIPYFYSTTTFTKAWLWQKIFFSFHNYVDYTVIIEKKVFVHIATTFTTSWWREIFFFILLLRSLRNYIEKKVFFLM